MKEEEVNQIDTGLATWPCPMATSKTLTLKFQSQSLKLPYLKNGRADFQGTKELWVVHSWLWPDDIDIAIPHTIEVPLFSTSRVLLGMIVA